MRIAEVLRDIINSSQFAWPSTHVYNPFRCTLNGVKIIEKQLFLLPK